MTDLTIRQIVDKIKSGNLRIPAFQRGFVWDADKVAFLMDSIYKGYPIGSLLLWRTKERLNFERKLGPFTIPEPEEDFPVDYILDGQQRITSIFGVFQTELLQDPESDSSWMNIYCDLRAGVDAQESQFLALSPKDADPLRYLPLKTLFDTITYRKATKDLDDSLAEQVDAIQTKFKEARVPIQTISTEDKTTVAIVFERINRRNVPLDTLQLLTAWTWSQEFHLQQQFDDLTSELKPFGFHDVGEDKNLLLRCCSAVLANNASTETLITLNGVLVRQRFTEVVNGIKGAIDFLKSNLHIHSLENLPYPYLLIPLSVYFATPENKQVKLNNNQRKIIIRWFWRVCFSKRYNSQPIKTMQADIELMLKLRDGLNSELGNFSHNILTADNFQNDSFRINNVNTKTFVLLLAQKSPKSFVSGQPISLQKALRDYNRNEFHHLYPRSFLKSLDESDSAINCLANFSFMSRVDNNTLAGVAPSKYRTKMPSSQSAVVEILQHSFCSMSLFSDNFSVFIKERAQMLADEGNKLMG